MSAEIDWTLLDRYFSGECTPSEAAALQQWVAADPARAGEVAAARWVWGEAGAAGKRFDVAAARAAVHARMAEEVRAVGAARIAAPARMRPFAVADSGRRAPAWAIAAGIAALLVGGGFALRAVLGGARSEIAPVATREYAAPRGQRSEFRLSDGTRVVLGPESQIIVSAGYGAAARNVELRGEAYFEVVHDQQRPFAVRAGATVARDLGTRFAVRAYAADADVRVVVAEGRVALGTQQLSAHQVGRVGADGQVSVRAAADLDPYLAWTGGRLVFANTPLIEALPELNRWYNLDFQLADSALATLPLSGTLEDRPTAETLQLLAITLGVSVERHGNTVVLARRPRLEATGSRSH